MTETKTYCDHCGKELNNRHDYIGIEIDTVKDFVACDLCDDCVTLFDKNVKEFLHKSRDDK